MELTVIHKGRPLALSFQPLTPDYLDAAAELCDHCVGKNLYPKSYLASVLNQPDHYFDLLVTPEGVAVGYFYFYLTDLAEMAAQAKLPKDRLSVVSGKADPVIANLRSIGIAENFRSHRLSEALLCLALERLQTVARADAAVGICWKAGGHVPMDQILRSLDFHYLTDAHRVWYDNEALVCPYCQGRCVCDAAIYYKTLGKKAGI